MYICIYVCIYIYIYIYIYRAAGSTPQPPMHRRERHTHSEGPVDEPTLIRRHQTCHFCAFRARRGNLQCLQKSSKYAGPSRSRSRTSTEAALLAPSGKHLHSEGAIDEPALRIRPQYVASSPGRLLQRRSVIPRQFASSLASYFNADVKLRNMLQTRNLIMCMFFVRGFLCWFAQDRRTYLYCLCYCV